MNRVFWKGHQSRSKCTETVDRLPLDCVDLTSVMGKKIERLRGGGCRLILDRDRDLDHLTQKTKDKNIKPKP